MSLSDIWRVIDGNGKWGDTYFGTYVGKWVTEGAGKCFLAEGGKFFYPMRLYSKCSDFCGQFKCW